MVYFKAIILVLGGEEGVMDIRMILSPKYMEVNWLVQWSHTFFGTLIFSSEVCQENFDEGIIYQD